MATSVNRSRAAIICFGGWGLQTMLHIWPRLQLVQEQRQVLGLHQQFPDLSRLTAHAAIIPTYADASEDPGALPFHVLRPRPDRPPGPFYLARRLAELEASPVTGVTMPLTHAEQAGARLLTRVLHDGHVERLAVSRLPIGNGVPDNDPLTRATMFRRGIQAAETAVRSLISQVIDPTRLDSMQTRDPFVQTTIYIIGSLAEPLASALIWPVVSEMVATLGSSHVARVVAFLGTGSFTADDTRVVEEATVHATLSELTALTGIGDGKTGALYELVKRCGGSGWAQRVGKRLFDMIYLIDREKSNQALAQSAYELSLVVGNAIEAFLVADGASHLERSLGPDFGIRPASPFSVLGAASDYVPVAEYIALAVEAAQKQVIRSEVLSAGSAQETRAGRLAEIGASTELALDRFVDASPAGLFEMTPTANTPGQFPALRIAPNYFLPEPVVNKLQAAHTLTAWQNAVQARTQTVAAELAQIATQAHAAWGLRHSAHQNGGKFTDENAPGAPDFLSDVLSRAREKLASDICSAPNGITRAQTHIAGWLAETETILNELDAAAPEVGTLDRRHRDLAMWQQMFNAAGNRQSKWRPWLFAGLGMAVVLAAAFWFLQESTLSLTQAQRVVTVASSLGLLALIPLVTWLSLVQPIRSLKRRRIAMARAELSADARARLIGGLTRVYRRLHEDLSALHAHIQATVDDLTTWSGTITPPDVLLAETGAQHLRTAHTDESVWASVLDLMRATSVDGKITQERFRNLWRANGPTSAQRLAGDNGLLARVHTALQDLPHGQQRAALTAIFREYATRATEYLCPNNQLLAAYPDLVQEVADCCGIEKLLTQNSAGLTAEMENSSQFAFVENIFVRAKPSANYEVAAPSSPYTLELEFGVTPNGADSVLQPAFARRYVPLLPSADPFSVSLVRTVNHLMLQELATTARCEREFRRLHHRDRDLLTLLPPTTNGVADPLYGTSRDDLVAYQQSVFMDIMAR